MVMVAARDCHIVLGSACLAMVSAAWDNSEDDACGINIMGRIGLQQTMVGCLAWLDYLVWYIIGSWRKRLIWLASMAAEVLWQVKQGGVDL